MSRGTTRRTVRIDDELWGSAQTKAEAEGVSLSEIIRQALQSFVDLKDFQPHPTKPGVWIAPEAGTYRLPSRATHPM